MASDEVRAEDFGFIYLDVDDPAIAWLTYRGLISSSDIASTNPGNISWFFTKLIKRGLSSTLEREGKFEGIRQKSFKEKLSRLNSLYAFDNVETAREALKNLGKFNSENLVSIEPADQGFRREIYDMQWIDNFDLIGIDAAKRYWSGKNYPDHPIPEALLSGRFWILGTSVRKRAYETIQRLDPKALAVLELARLATHFGSNLGAISPWLRKEGEAIIVSQIINYDEKEGLEVFQRALGEHRKNPEFPINWPDLRPLTESQEDKNLDDLFRVPDGRLFEHEFRIDKATELAQTIQNILLS